MPSKYTLLLSSALIFTIHLGCADDPKPSGQPSPTPDMGTKDAQDMAQLPKDQGTSAKDMTTAPPDMSAQDMERMDQGQDMSAPPARGNQLFSSDKLLWNQEITNKPKDARSDTLMTRFKQAGGFGFGRVQIDFSLEVLKANKNTPRRAFTKTRDFYEEACDHVPFPIPEGGNIEGEDGYACVGDGDCHLIVHDEDEHKLYEMWRANIQGQEFFGGCAAVWELDREYPDSLRGQGCTSADAAGLPIAGLLFNADEIAAGEIAHAIRLILPNDRIKRTTFVRPATHGVGTSQNANAMPYGVRLRLRADYPMASLPNDATRTIAKAMQRYGMILSDGGNIALTAQSDRHTQHKWSEVGLGSRDLDALKPDDFEVVDMGQVYAFDGFPGCDRNTF